MPYQHMSADTDLLIRMGIVPLKDLICHRICAGKVQAVSCIVHNRNLKFFSFECNGLCWY